MVERALIVHPEAAVRSSIGELLRHVASEAVTVHEAVTPAEGLRSAQWLDPGLVLLDLREERGLVLEVAREIRRPGRRLIGLYDPLLQGARELDFFRQATRAGFDDFVPLPPSEAELSAAVAAGREGERQREAEGRLLAFFSHKGGVGKTTLALGAALTLARASKGDEVAFCDAALQFGSAATFLGLQPESDVCDLARDLDRATGASTSLTVHPPTGLRLLASPRDPLDSERLTPEALTRILVELRRRFRVVVVDTPSVLDLMTMAVFDLADLIFLITEGVTPTLRGTARLLELLERLGFEDRRLRVVLNGYTSSDIAVAESAVSREVGRAVDHVVPYDPAVVAGANRGAPLVLTKPKSDFAQAVRDLARRAVRVENEGAPTRSTYTLG